MRNIPVLLGKFVHVATAISRCYYLSVAGALGGRMAIAGTQDFLKRQISSLTRFTWFLQYSIQNWGQHRFLVQVFQELKGLKCTSAWNTLRARCFRAASGWLEFYCPIANQPSDRLRCHRHRRGLSSWWQQENNIGSGGSSRRRGGRRERESWKTNCKNTERDNLEFMTRVHSFGIRSGEFCMCVYQAIV